MTTPKAEVRLNHCNCHPETCCCDDWAVYVGNEKHSTHFNKGTAEIVAQALNQSAQQTKFKRGDRVFKPKGSSWYGTVVGEYSTKLTPEGYAVESAEHPGSVQIYPAAALEAAGYEPPARNQ